MKKAPLILWGGVDVDPNYYHQAPLKYTQQPSKHRDEKEFSDAKKATAEGRPIIGVCRGAQLLCVLNGGTLFQHSRPLRQDHSIETSDGEIFDRVSAGHHQIMRPVGNYELLAWNPSVTRVWYSDEDSDLEIDTPEVIYYPEQRHLCIQPHPEWAAKTDPFLHWVNKLLDKLEIDYEF